MADVSITPSGAGLSATGNSGWGLNTFGIGSWSIGAGPSIVIGYVITPVVNATVVTGYAPSIFLENIIIPTGGTEVVGSAPSVIVGGTVIIPSAGSVSVTGYAPSTQFELLGGWGFGPWGAGAWGTNDSFITTVTGSASFAGYASNTAVSNIAQSNPAVLSFTGVQAQVSRSVAPDSGTITAVGYEPTSVYGNIQVPTGGTTLTGSDPTVIVAGTVIVTVQGSLTATGYAPTTEFGLLGGWGFGPWGYGEWGTDDTNIDTVTGTISITGYAPSVVYGNIVTATGGISAIGSVPSVVVGGTIIIPDVGAIVATGQAPFVDNGIVPSTGVVQFTGVQPNVVRTNIATGATGTVTLTGVAPQSVVGKFSAPSTGTAQIIGIAPYLDKGIVTTTGAVNVTGYAPDEVRGDVVTPTGGVDIIGSVPSVVVSGKVIVLPTGDATFTGQLPYPAQSTVITPNNGTLRLVGGTAVLSDPDWIVIDTSQTPSWVQIAA